MSRTIEVDLQQDYTVIVVLDDEGKPEDVATSSTPGPTLERIVDPDGGPDFDNDEVFEFVITEGY